MNELLKQFHHDTEWLPLRLLLEAEYRAEWVRMALRAARVPRVVFRFHGDLVRLMKLK